MLEQNGPCSTAPPPAGRPLSVSQTASEAHKPATDAVCEAFRAPPRKTLLLDWREGNRRAVLCWDRVSSLGRRYGPAGSSISGSRLKQTVYTAKKKENQLDLYVDCTETRRRMPQPRLYVGVRRIIWKTGAHPSRLTTDCYIRRLRSLHKLSNGGGEKPSIFPQL